MSLPFNSRELSWLDFNTRVLEEALKPSNPVLERLKFLAITASNLDEFFMVRVAYLLDRSKNKEQIKDDAGRTPKEQLELVLERSHDFMDAQYATLKKTLLDLAQEDIHLADMDSLTTEQANFARELFHDEILPVLTPLAVDPSRPFPFLLNKSINLAVRLEHDEEDEPRYGLVQVPGILPRFLPIPAQSGHVFLPLEALIAHYLPRIFSLHAIRAHCFFRITRSADFDVDEDTDDLLEEMQRTIRKRKRGRPIRLEISDDCDEKLQSFLVKRLQINKKYVFPLPGPLDLAAFSKIASMPGGEALCLPPIKPVPAADFEGFEGDIFAAIREGDRMVHHPYQTFDHVIAFIQQAAEDPDVLAIKQTLYRVSGQSKIISALEHAAELGKQVTVLVELKARFDEENNIQWAKRLERAGCHVIYGLAGLKTHCKITLVVRRERAGIRRYLHLSTGNYNDVTARFYTDIGLFTYRASFGADASALFNHLTGYSTQPEYNKLVVAPTRMKSFFLRMIDQEMAAARAGRPCGITIKVNSLLEGTVIRKLYDASNAGVPIRLIVRGICGLMPGVPGVSENIRVRSLVGQLLEHSRIFCFHNGGDPRVYMGSADLMPRNLDRRIELVFPVEDAALRRRLLDILELMWKDNVNAREQNNRGEYVAVDSDGPAVNSQWELARQARQELLAAMQNDK